MHILHRILVNIEDINREAEEKGFTKEEFLAMIKNEASDAIEPYRDRVFDYHSNDAGGWADDYPVNVKLADEDLNYFLYEIENAKDLQNTAVNDRIQQLSETTLNVSKLTRLYRNGELDGSMKSYYLLVLARLLYGEYFYDSGFYDVEEYTARIDKNTIEKVKANPKDYALVFFDLHY